MVAAGLTLGEVPGMSVPTGQPVYHSRVVPDGAEPVSDAEEPAQIGETGLTLGAEGDGLTLMVIEEQPSEQPVAVLSLLA